MKAGLVLEGGAMRGLFTAGVIDVLMENNIKFDGAVGVSAGAAFGVNYKSHQIGRVLRYNLKFAETPALPVGSHGVSLVIYMGLIFVIISFLTNWISLTKKLFKKIQWNFGVWLQMLKLGNLFIIN